MIHYHGGPITPDVASLKVWLAKLQAVLNECPSDRLGFTTVGDCSVGVYDCTRHIEAAEYLDRNGGEYDTAIERIGALFPLALELPNPVEGVAG